LPHDRAQRPDMSQGSDPSSSGDGGGGRSQMGGSLPDIRAQSGVGTYFLGRYRIVDEIGIGGMASVHLARMDGPGGFQKWVAIKKIHSHLVEDESFVQMFLDEARVAARISHPNVATVFDLGKHEDTYWIAMEYLHGEPLREVMRRTEELGTAMPPEIACRVIADAAEGLHAAHELLGKNGEKLGLVHRDVTPHNLFVTYDGVTKVVDFGIAKFSSRMSHTRAGTLKGKLAYMSPEQVHGEGIDRRTDIFALGVVLWELTTGQRLFRMESDLDTLAKVQECNVPRPSTLIRGYPVDLEKIVMKALSKNRGERFRTAREFSRALQSLLMRRGLFIASDEVAAYTQSIFNDRIQKREAHLRWAAEVTSTINVDQLLSKPALGAEFTGASDVQAQAKPAGVRPAAGIPAPVTGPMAEPETLDHRAGFGGANLPDGMNATGPSLATQARPATGQPSSAPSPPRPRSGAPAAPQTGRGSSANQAPPRPAAGMPASLHAQPYAQQQTGGFEEDHPADGDGPTIQALPPMLEGLPSLDLDDSRDARSEPPTRIEPAHQPQNDGPTMMASPGARAQMIAASPSDEILALEPDEDFEEDQDETMVANLRGEPSPLQAPPTFPQVASSTDRPGQASSAPGGQAAPRRPPPPTFGQTVGLSQPAPPIPLGYPSPPGGGGHGPLQPSRSAEVPFNDLMGMPQQHHGPQGYEMGNFGPMGAQPQDFAPRSGPHPTGPGGEFIPRQARMQPTIPRGAVNYDNRTMTVQRYKRRPPMWVVAALSCSIALLIAGVVIAVVSSTGSPPAPKTSSSGAPSADRSGAPAGAAAAAASGGPFDSARAAFDKVAAAQPGASATPPPLPPDAPPAAVTAPPILTAAAADPEPTPTPPAAPPPAAPAAPASPSKPPVAAFTAPRPAPAPQPVAAPAATPKKPAALGAITVVCMPKCDQIIDNGTSLGPGHIFNRPVASGRHVLQLSAPNGARKNLVVEVVPEQTKEVRMSMDR
jgi:eukaryotic-like serine/threonine-protein kinase